MVLIFRNFCKIFVLIVLSWVCLGTSIRAQENGLQASEETETDIADFILLGERHGVEDQQFMIAATLLEASKSSKKIGVVMEMISADQVELVETFRKLSPESSQNFGAAIGWSKTNWPDYKYYAPIFRVIWGKNMALAPGDPSAKDQERWRRGDFADYEYDPKSVLSRVVSQSAADNVEASWTESMNKAHCGQLGGQEAKDVARLQMMRDAYMANQMRAMKTAGADIVVLISGRAHIRRDRGVPLYLGEYVDAQSIAIVETDPKKTNGETYQPETAQKEILPYDLIILTAPIEEKESACDRLRRKGLIK